MDFARGRARRFECAMRSLFAGTGGRAAKLADSGGIREPEQSVCFVRAPIRPCLRPSRWKVVAVFFWRGIQLSRRAPGGGMNAWWGETPSSRDCRDDSREVA